VVKLSSELDLEKSEKSLMIRATQTEYRMWEENVRFLEFNPVLLNAERQKKFENVTKKFGIRTLRKYNFFHTHSRIEKELLVTKKLFFKGQFSLLLPV
jgi:hypothetical protein